MTSLMMTRIPFFCSLVILLTFCAADAPAAGPNGAPELGAEQFLQKGIALADQTYYLEALDLLEEAREMLNVAGQTNGGLYADVLFALAQTKIKARLHQNFPALYVKTALVDVQQANRIREKIPGILPQKLAESYFLEGFIQKRFFMRIDVAASLFRKAISIEPHAAAAKRELSELITTDEEHKDKQSTEFEHSKANGKN
jgi:hypothetical protein